MNYRFLPQERIQQSRTIPPTPKTPARIGAHEFEGAISAPLREEMFAVALLIR
jgi:hypothetical protein